MACLQKLRILRIAGFIFGVVATSCLLCILVFLHLKPTEPASLSQLISARWWKEVFSFKPGTVSGQAPDGGGAVIRIQVGHPREPALAVKPIKRGHAQGTKPSRHGQALPADAHVYYNTSQGSFQLSNCRNILVPEAENAPWFQGLVGRGTKYIPVLGIPVVGDPELYLLRLLYSIKYPVKHLILLQGGDDPFLEREVQHITKHFNNLHIVKCMVAFSCSEAWNYILQRYFASEPWYMISAYDVQYPPGVLAKIATSFWADSKTDVELGFVGYRNMDPGGWNVFMMTHKLLLRLGFFDENIYPAYFEDTELRIRMRSLQPPVKKKTYEEHKAIHGRAADEGYKSGVDPLLADPEYKIRMLRGVNATKLYLIMKWGCLEDTIYDYDIVCTFSRPFNGKDVPVGYWQRIPEMRRFALTGEGWDSVVDTLTALQPPAAVQDDTDDEEQQEQ